MNKKGYTLIEILIVVAIISVIGLTATIGLDKVIKNSKSDRYSAMLSEIKEAANTYITVMEPSINAGLYINLTETITIEELQESLLLDRDLKNPKDNTLVSGTVEIIYNAGNGSITYNVILE